MPSDAVRKDHTRGLLRGGGRRGPNKTTTALKEAILLAAAEHGEDDEGTDGLKGYLRKIAREDVKAMSGLLGRVLPLQINGAGENGEHLHKVDADDAFSRVAAALAVPAPRAKSSGGEEG